MAIPGTHEEVHQEGQGAEVANVAGTYDLKWDSDSKERSLDHGCQRGTAVFAVAARFTAHKKKLWARGKRCRMARSESAARERLGRAASDSEFTNSLLESGSFHSKTRRRPIQARHNPVALLQRFQDLLTF